VQQRRNSKGEKWEHIRSEEREKNSQRRKAVKEVKPTRAGNKRDQSYVLKKKELKAETTKGGKQKSPSSGRKEWGAGTPTEILTSRNNCTHCGGNPTRLR